MLLFMLAATSMPMSAEIYIVIIGVAYTIMAATLQRKLSNPKRVRELQEKIKIHSKELNDMIKGNAPKDELNKKQSEMMPLVKESMTSNMKATFVLIPTFLIVYYLIVPALFGGLKADVATFSLASYNFSLQYRGLFFVTVFFLGLISSISIMLYDRRKAKIERLAMAGTATKT